MIKRLAIGLVVALATACSNAPTVQESAESYVVIGTAVNQATGTITVNIRVHPPATREHVQAVAEKAISQYSKQYPNVTVRSYVGAGNPSELPFATSILDNGAVTHQFHAAASQKIPTH